MKSSFVPRILGVLLLCLGLTGCFGLQVKEGVYDADGFFDEAYAEIGRLQSGQGRGGHRAHRLCVLVHDGREGKLVRVSVPLWVVNAAMDLGIKEEDQERSHDFDFGKRYDLEWKAVKDLGRFGPGLLVEVDDDQERILVWLK